MAPVSNPAPRLSIENLKKPVVTGAAPADEPVVRIPRGSGLGNRSEQMGPILGGEGNPAWDGGPLPRQTPPPPPPKPELPAWQPSPEPWKIAAQPIVVDVSEPDPAAAKAPSPKQENSGSWYPVPGTPGMRVFSPNVRKGKVAAAAAAAAAKAAISAKRERIPCGAKGFPDSAFKPAAPANIPPPSPRMTAKYDAPYWQRLHPEASPRPASARPASARPASKRGAFPAPQRAPPTVPHAPPTPRPSTAESRTVLRSGELDRMVQSAATLAATFDIEPPKVPPAIAWPEPAPAPPTELVDELPPQLQAPTAWVGSVTQCGRVPPDEGAKALQADTLARRERVFPAATSSMPIKRPTKRVAMIPGVSSQICTVRTVSDLHGAGEVKLQPSNFFQSGGMKR